MKKLTFLLLSFFVFNVASAQSSVVAECLKLNSNIRQGMKDSNASNSVYTLQSFLKTNNYITVNPTGYFGAQTLKGVKAFQKAQNISTTGMVGPLTRSAIEKMSCISNIPETPVESVTSTPTIPVVEVPAVPPAPPVVEDVILTAPNNSSLKVRTDGVVTIATDSLLVRGSIIAGARSSTQRWFELTRNQDVYKLSETTSSPKTPQRTNDNFQQLFTGLTSGVTYYYRVCADNVDIGQKSCGSSVSVKTN